MESGIFSKGASLILFVAALLQSLFGYDALNAGLVMSPAGLFAILLMPVIAFLLGRGKDARWIVLAGLLVMAAGNYWMSQMNRSISPGFVIGPRVLTVVGLSMCFAPLNVAAYLYTPKMLRGAAVGLLSLLRTDGGSVGTSLAQTLHERLYQVHTLRLGEYLDPFNPAVHAFLGQVRAFFLGQTGDPALSKQMAWQGLATLRGQQASSLAYFDCFWVFALIVITLVPLVFLMKRSVAEKGSRIGAE
jgi:DHA2 family multidrug resistance protein